MIKKLLSWHRFPFWVFHLPTVPYIAWLALRARSPLFMTAANPLMSENAFRRTAKSRVLRGLPDEVLPATRIWTPEEGTEALLRWLERSELPFPLVVKPHSGERGRGVERLRDASELEGWASSVRGEWMVQELVDLPLELGVLYHRFPGRSRGRITSLARKHLPAVTGDGRRDLGTLIREQIPSRLRARLLSINSHRLGSVPPNGETVVVDFVAQPFLGSRIECLNDRITPRMEETFDRLTSGIEGFCYGRFDLKAQSLEKLERGEGLRVLELNLNASMPLHIWDPKYGTIATYRELLRDWQLLAEISAANRREGTPLMTLSQGLAQLRARRQLPVGPGGGRS